HDALGATVQGKFTIELGRVLLEAGLDVPHYGTQMLPVDVEKHLAQPPVTLTANGAHILCLRRVQRQSHVHELACGDVVDVTKNGVCKGCFHCSKRVITVNRASRFSRASDK